MIFPLSYNRCATIIVRLTEYPNLRDASCCKVEVVKGADGVFFAGFTSSEEIVNVADLHFSKNARASCADLKLVFNSALKLFPFEINSAETLYDEIEL